jgi:hypothetical protein
MNTRQALRLCLDAADMITRAYLDDLTDTELLVRSVPGANHIAWQLGHLIVSENGMMNGVRPGSMPALPSGFSEKYTADTSRLDSAGCFHPKSTYLELYTLQRSATLAALETLSDGELDNTAPEPHSRYTKNIGDLVSMIGTHWVMHAGQWAITRRKLGRKPLF